VAILVLCTALMTGCGGGEPEDANAPATATQSQVSESPSAEEPWWGSESDQTQTQGDEKDVEPSSSCVAVREAVLSGDKGQIRRALRALKNDETASATARQSADDYLDRDADNPERQQMDLSLIQASCL
jgi:hypothetical protein